MEHFFQRRQIYGQKTWKRILQITLGGCKSKPQWDTSYLSDWLFSKRQETSGEDVEKEPSCTVGGNVTWFSHCGKLLRVLKKTKNRTAIWSSNSTSRYLSGEITDSKRYLYPYVHKPSRCNVHVRNIVNNIVTTLYGNRW